MNSIYIVIFLIILVILFFYNRSIINREEFVGETPCYGQIGSRNRIGDDYFFTNDMLATKLNRKERIVEQKGKDQTTLDMLQKYKDNILESNKKYQSDLKQFNTLNQNIDGAFATMNNEVNKSVLEANTKKQNSLGIIGKIGEKISKALSGSADSTLDERLKPIIKTSLENQLNEIQNETLQNNIVPLIGLAARVSDKDTNIFNWQFLPQSGQSAPLRVDPISGEVQCLSFDGKNCESDWIAKNGEDYSKIDQSKLKPLSCGLDHLRSHGNDGYSTPGHWCQNAYNYYAEQSIENNDYSSCPKGWTLIDAEKYICQAPTNYSKCPSVPDVKKLYPNECGKQSCANFNEQNTPVQKRDWAKNCNASFPFKVNIKAINNSFIKPAQKVADVIQNRIGTPNINIMDKFNTMKNGILVKGYRLTPNFGRGEKILENLITTTINFRWAASTILGIQPNGADRIFLEFSGFLRVPNGANSLKFRMGSDDGSRLLIAENGDVNNLNTIISMLQLQGHTNKESNTINVISGTFLPYLVEFFENDGYASVVLEWSVNGGAFQVIPRDAYFVDKTQCSNKFSLGFAADENRRYLNVNMAGGSLVLNQNGVDYVYSFSQGGLVNKINKATGQVMNIGGGGKEYLIVNDNMYIRNNSDMWYVDQNNTWFLLNDPSIIDFLNKQLDIAKTNKVSANNNKVLNFRNFGGSIIANTGGVDYIYSFQGQLDTNGNRAVRKVEKESGRDMMIGGSGTNFILYNNKIYLINALFVVFSDENNDWRNVNDSTLKAAILDEFRRLRPLVPKISGKIVDCGYSNLKRGWYDIQGQGSRNDYCRFVGGPGPVWMSCAINGFTNNTPLEEVIPENMPNDNFTGGYGC